MPSPQKTAVEQALPKVAQQLLAERPDTAGMVQIFQAYLQANPNVYGIAFAPPPPAAGASPAASPYVYRSNGGFQTADLGSNGYEFWRMVWYTRPKALRRPVWSPRYFDQGGGNIVMTTYTIPMFDQNNQFYGVVTSDLPAAAPR